MVAGEFGNQTASPRQVPVQIQFVSVAVPM
jgi:hypothetical protein